MGVDEVVFVISRVSIRIPCSSIAVDKNISRSATLYQFQGDNGEVVAEIEASWRSPDSFVIEQSVNKFLGEPVLLGSFRLERTDDNA